MATVIADWANNGTVPQQKTSGNWTPSNFNTGKIRFTMTFTNASTNSQWRPASLTYWGILTTNDVNGGAIWLEYNPSGTAHRMLFVGTDGSTFLGAMTFTWSAGQTVTFTFDQSSGTASASTMTIAGALTGNGTSSGWTRQSVFSGANLTWGAWGSGGFTLPASWGTEGDTDDGNDAITGTLTKTLGTLTSSATGTVAIQGSTTATLGALTVSAAGTIPIVGDLTKTLGALTVSAAGTIPIVGDLTKTLGALTVVATGGLTPIEGTASNTLGTLTSDAQGQVAIQGSLNATLGAVTSAAAGGSGNINGTLSATLGALTLAATNSDRQGTLTKTLGALTSSAQGQVEISGLLSKTLGALTVSAQGNIPITGSLDKTLGALTLVASESDRVGTLSKTLGALTSSATGIVSIQGTLSATLGALTLVASNNDFGPGVSSSAIATFGHAASSLSAPGGYLPSGGGGADMDGRTPTAVNTQTSGSSYYAVVGRAASASGLTDNKGNTWTEIRSDAYSFFNPAYSAWEAAQYYCLDGAGGTNHIVTTPTTVSDEGTLFWSEIIKGHVMHDHSFAARAQGATQISAAVSCTGPAWVYVDWMGGGGVSGAEGSVWTVTAQNEGSTVGSQWQVVDSRIVNHTDGWIQCKRWRRYYAEATTNIQLQLSSLSPDQGAFFYAAVFQESEYLNGTLTKTLGALTSSATGIVETQGTLAKTLGALTSSAQGQVAIQGSANATLGSLTIAATATTAILGSLSGTLGALTGSATGQLLIQGTLAKTLGALVGTSGGTVEIQATLSVTLGNLTLSATGTIPIVGDLTKTLGALTVVANGVGNTGGIGELEATLGALTVVATAAIETHGDLTKTLGALTSVAEGSVALQGLLDKTLGALVSSASGLVEIKGTLNTTLGSLTLVATIAGDIAGEVNITLGSLDLTAGGGKTIEINLAIDAVANLNDGQPTITLRE